MCSMDHLQKLVVTVLIFKLAIHLEAVTVSSQLCPTNKIAPHRRVVSWDQNRPRTLGLIYNLFTPGRPRPPPYNNLHDLQEQPEADDPNDCGEIEDYDETDLSSITPGGQNKIRNNRNDRFLFNDNYIRPTPYPTSSGPQYRPTTSRPQRSTYPPKKPAYSSGGIFGSNVYRPQEPHHPSNYIKPVQENFYDKPQAGYTPGLVGGPIGHVVGFQPVIPTNGVRVPTQQRPNAHIRFPDDETNVKGPVRRDQKNVATGIIGSFVDLLFH